jgi:hypothetical protein
MGVLRMKGRDALARDFDRRKVDHDNIPL